MRRRWMMTKKPVLRRIEDLNVILRPSIVFTIYFLGDSL
jgi:hypothetical protein